jgi:hypothetical protein
MGCREMGRRACGEAQTAFGRCCFHRPSAQVAEREDSEDGVEGVGAEGCKEMDDEAEGVCEALRNFSCSLIFFFCTDRCTPVFCYMAWLVCIAYRVGDGPSHFC